MADGKKLDEGKVNEILDEIKKTIDDIRDEHSTFPDECDEALKRFVEVEYDLELPDADANDTSGNEDSGFNKGP